VDAPVVSVGNLTLGGTGKTPFSVYLADHFLAGGRKPAILIRGYGDDEHRMLRDELPDVPVYTGRDRVKSAETAIKRNADVLILDDGFQHRRIKRDLDILLVDSLRPFGNGFLFPRGVLREPASSVARADIIVVTKADKIGPKEKKDLFDGLSIAAPGKPVAFARHKVTFLSDVTGSSYSRDYLKGKRVCVVSGIADPDYFSETVSGLGGIVDESFDFGDHHSYTQKDIDLVARVAKDEKFDIIVITTKDHVKIKDLDISEIENKLIIIHVAVEFAEGEEKIIAGLNRVNRA
jgi:tetraacyldisaccharide 4'-kinase